MATFTHTLQGTTPTTIEDTDILQFAGSGGFDSKITVASYNDTTHVKSSVGADDSSGNTPKNSKFISQSGGTGGDSQVDIGGGTVDLDTISTANCPLKINFADDASVSTEDAIFYSYNGTAPATAMVGVDFRAAEQGDANWTEAEGSGSALALADNSTPGTSHDFFLLVSASPTSVGLKEGAYRIELTYF